MAYNWSSRNSERESGGSFRAGQRVRVNRDIENVRNLQGALGRQGMFTAQMGSYLGHPGTVVSVSGTGISVQMDPLATSRSSPSERTFLWHPQALTLIASANTSVPPHSSSEPSEAPLLPGLGDVLGAVGKYAAENPEVTLTIAKTLGAALLTTAVNSAWVNQEASAQPSTTADRPTSVSNAAGQNQQDTRRTGREQTERPPQRQSSGAEPEAKTWWDTVSAGAWAAAGAGMATLISTVVASASGTQNSGATPEKPFGNVDVNSADPQELRRVLKEEQNKRLCPVCRENRKTVAFQCGHMACSVCARIIDRCQICHENIVNRIDVYD